MIESILLVEGSSVDEEALRSCSLSNAKQLVFGRFGHGHVLHVRATTAADLSRAMADFASVPGVNTVLTLAMRT
jgi:hypothetical protein